MILMSCGTEILETVRCCRERNERRAKPQAEDSIYVIKTEEFLEKYQSKRKTFLQKLGYLMRKMEGKITLYGA